MVWYLGDTPVDGAALASSRIAGVTASKRLDGPDAIWSWWIFPQAAYANGYTYLGAVTSAGDQIVIEIDNATLAVSTVAVSTGAYVDDDHNAVAVLPLSNGWLLAAYTGHNEDYTLRWRISTTGRIADLGAEQSRQMQSSNRTTTYVQLMESPTTPGKVFWFVRIATNNWYSVISTDYGQTFGIESSVISTTNQYYGLFRPLPGRQLIRAFVYPHPRYSQNTLRVLDIDMSSLTDGLVITNGSGRGYLGGSAYNGAALPMTEATIPALYTSASAANSIRLLASSPRGDMVVIAEFETAPPSTNPVAVYKLGRLTGTNAHDSTHWTWTTLISDVYPFGESNRYYGGVEFETAPHSGIVLYIAYQTATNGQGVLERWQSDDAAAWRRSLVTRSNNPQRIMRPSAPLNATADMALLWSQGAWTTYLDYSATVRAARTARRATSLADLRWGIRAQLLANEGDTAKFLISWFGAPIPAGTTCTIDLAESGTATDADFGATLDAAMATAVTGKAGLSYDAASNRLSVTSAAVSPLVVSRAIASGDATDDLETWTLTLSNPSHGAIQESASASMSIVDPLGAPLNGLSTGPAAAWGMDRLRSLYSGPAIRLRRSSDDVESDFGFVAGGLLDTSAITTWLNGDTGYGVTWYDQTGNSNHAAQSTKANQPVLVLNATPNSRPVWRFNGGTQYFAVPHVVAINNIYAGGGYSAWGFRANAAGGGSAGRVYDKNTGQVRLAYQTSTLVEFSRSFTDGTFRKWRSTVPTAGGSAWVVHGCEYNSDANTNLPVTRVNSATAGTSFSAPTLSGVTSDAAADLLIGNMSGGTRGWDGDIFAGAWFQDVPGLTDQEKVEDGIMVQYGVT